MTKADRVRLAFTIKTDGELKCAACMDETGSSKAISSLQKTQGVLRHLRQHLGTGAVLSESGLEREDLAHGSDAVYDAILAAAAAKAGAYGKLKENARASDTRRAIDAKKASSVASSMVPDESLRFTEPVTRERADRLAARWGDLVIENALPLTLGRSSSAAALAQEIGVSGNAFSYEAVSKYVETEHSTYMSKTAAAVQDLPVCIAFDGLTVGSIKILGISVHVIDDGDFEPEHYILALRHVTEAAHYTAEVLASTYEEVLSEYNIHPEDVVAIVSDGAADMVAFRNKMRQKYKTASHGCLPHYMSNCLAWGLDFSHAPHAATLLYYLRLVIYVFQKSYGTGKLLEQAQMELIATDAEYKERVNGKVWKLKRAVVTRWTSKIDSIERAMLVWPAIERAFKNPANSKPAVMSGYETAFLVVNHYMSNGTFAGIVEAAAPIVAGIRVLEGDEYDTMPLVMRTLRDSILKTHGCDLEDMRHWRSDAARRATLQADVNDILQEREHELMKSEGFLVGDKHNPVMPAARELNGEKFWYIESIASAKEADDGTRQIKIKWKGFKEPSWHIVDDELEKYWTFYKTYGKKKIKDIDKMLNEKAMTDVDRKFIDRLLTDETEHAVEKAKETLKCTSFKPILEMTATKDDVVVEMKEGMMSKLLRHPLVPVALFVDQMTPATDALTCSSFVNSAIVALLIDPVAAIKTPGLRDMKAGHFERFIFERTRIFPDSALKANIAMHKQWYDDVMEKRNKAAGQIDYSDDESSGDNNINEIVPDFPDLDKTVRKDWVAFLAGYEEKKMYETFTWLRKVEKQGAGWSVRQAFGQKSPKRARVRDGSKASLFWGDDSKCGGLPLMKSVAFAIRCVCAGQTTVERVFSAVKRNYRPDRQSLKSKALEMIVMLQHSYKRLAKKNKAARKINEENLRARCEFGPSIGDKGGEVPDVGDIFE